MSKVIPKESLSAYQRWELASFNEIPNETRKETCPAPSVSAAELAQLREEARAQGYSEGMASGLEEGRAEGFAQGLAEGREQARQQAAHLQTIASEFGDAVTGANEQIAGDLLELGLDLAKAMLKTALQVKPELVLPIVSEAIRYLPTVKQPAMLFLHPEDARIVREHLADELEKSGWRLAEDPIMERGGCRVETATNQIDASTSLRWQRIADALGKNSDWFA